jgi:hypothetical protein
MSAVLTAASSMSCPHGGTVMAVPGSTRASVGSPILGVSDTCTIAGCAFAPSGAPSPCVTVRWTAPAGQVTHGGDPVLTESSVGLCLAATQAPQGTLLITSTQAKVSAQ